MTKKGIIILIIVFVFSSIGALVSFALTTDHDFFDYLTINEERKTSIENITLIDIEITSADLKFYLIDGDEIEVNLFGKIKCFVCNVSNKFHFEEKDNVLKIKSSINTTGIFLSTKLKMDIYLPKQYKEKLRISGVSADISLKDMELDDLKITSVSGDMNLTNLNINNEVVLKNTSGDIILNSLYADINFTTVSGDLDARKIYGNIKGKTTSGDVEIKINNDEFDIVIETVSGDVDIDLPENANFKFDLSTTSGDIEIYFNYIANINHENYQSGYVGSSNNLIKITTVSGDINIGKIK